MKEIYDCNNINVIGEASYFLDKKEAWGKFMITCLKCNTQIWKTEIINVNCEKCGHPLEIDYIHKDNGGLYKMHFPKQQNIGDVE